MKIVEMSLDDVGLVLAYPLEEILISHNGQNKGYGSMLLAELEKE